MVHDELHALRVGIFIEILDVEVRVRGDEVEDEVLLLAVPILPTFVPALDEYRVEAMLCREVDVAAHVLVVGSVLSVRLRLGVV